jgi:hypothetical protein
MADVSLEQIGQLLDEKLRPIKATLDEHTRLLDERNEGRQLYLKWPLAAFSLVAVVVAVVFVGRSMLARVDAGAGQSSAAAPGQLLYADEFTNPAKGLFLERQSGTSSLPADRASAQWDYAYQNGELVAHVGPPSLPLAGRLIGGSARGLNPLTGDFAFEVRARATRAPGSAVYGLRYFPGGRDFGFGIEPSGKRYKLWEVFRPPLLAAQSDAIASDDAENVLRLEVRGSALRLLVNGRAVDSLRDQAFGARPAAVGLFFDSTAPPGGDSVEVRYRDFRVYSLGSS